MSKLFQSNRLYFRTCDADTKEHVLGLYAVSAVTEFIGGPFSNEQILERYERELAFNAEFSVQYWPVFLIDGDVFIGCCGLRPYDVKNNIYELGFHFLPEHWGRGYAKEAALYVINRAFNHLNIATLFAGHNPRNTTSGIVLQKLGFVFDRLELYAPTGLEHPSYLLHRHREGEIGAKREGDT